MADANRLRAFASAFASDSVALEAHGALVAITRDELLEAADLIESVEGYAERADRYQAGAQVAQRLYEWVRQLEGAGLSVDPSLYSILGEEVQPEDEHDPQLVAIVNESLGALGVNSSEATARAMLDLIETYVNSQDPGGHADTVEPQQLVQSPAPAARAVARPVAPAPRVGPISDAQRRANLMPDNGLPRPATPGPFQPVGADALFGLQRGKNGRWDNGSLGG